MSCILYIETSTNICSVALSDDGQIVYKRVDLNGPSHAAVLGGFVEDVVSFADSHAMRLDAVAISEGPGSYTGLRIGTSMAKGICYGRNLKLISVPTLQLLCVPILLEKELPDDAWLCPMIDARRMEVYTAIYDRSLRCVRDVHPQIVNSTSAKDWDVNRPLYFFGNGADKCKAILAAPNHFFLSDAFPLAENMMPLAEKALAQSEVEDMAYFEPFYLKDFVGSKPKKII